MQNRAAIFESRRGEARIFRILIEFSASIGVSRGVQKEESFRWKKNGRMGGIFRFICHGWGPRCIVDLWCKLRKHADDDNGRVNRSGWIKDVEVIASDPFLGQLHFSTRNSMEFATMALQGLVAKEESKTKESSLKMRVLIIAPL